ncbi:MAG TPA: T9SS type B sorting domain-containing protein [Bacteroidia bacterium]
MKKIITILAIGCTLFNYSCRKDWLCIKRPQYNVEQADGTQPISYPNSVDVCTAFTPNGDGKNDLMYVAIYPGVTQFSLTITDDCKKILYQTTDATKLWDGKYEGKTIMGICNYSITTNLGSCSGKVQVVPRNRYLYSVGI